MATWGQQTWGFENWGTLGDAVADLSSVSLSATLSQGTITAEGVIQVGWGGDTWGENSWGELSGVFQDVTGVQASFSIGAVTTTANANIDVTGIQLNGTNDGVIAGTSVDPVLTGVQAQLFIGDETIDIGVPLTGIDLSATAGQATVDEQFLIGAGWGRDSWGSMVWGDAYSAQTGSVSAVLSIEAVAGVTADANVDLIGIELQSTIGDETAFTDHTVEVTGVELTSTINEVQALSVVGSQATLLIRPVDINADGNQFVNVFEDDLQFEIGNVSLDIGADIEQGGIQMDSAIGEETVTGTANVPVTGIDLSASIGEETAFTDFSITVTGIDLQASIGDESTTADANVTLTGIDLSVSIGDVEQNTIYDVSGIQAAISVGSVTTKADANVTLTGLGLTATAGSTSIFAWREIDPNVTNVWTEVDLAA